MDTLSKRPPNATPSPPQPGTSQQPILQPPVHVKSVVQTSRDQNPEIEKLLRETKLLKQKVDTLEKENTALKKSIYEFSSRYSATFYHGVRPGPLLIDPESSITEREVDDTEVSRAVQESGVLSMLNDPIPRKEGGRIFHVKFELKGHVGAVYTCVFAPNTKLLGSGSFDKTVRIWDTASTQNEIMCLRSHTLNVTDLSWTSDSSTILSGSYDQTCKVWDVESGKLKGNFETKGFVQCVSWDPSEPNFFYYGTSRNDLALNDVRADVNNSPNTVPIIICNDSMVNTIYASHDGVHIITGDSSGWLKTWDIRMKTCVQSFLNEQTKKPISHVAVSKKVGGDNDEEPRYMAVNSYDNVMRVYDRGLDPPKTPLRFIHALKGFKNKNWPIKSSFFEGRDYSSTPSRRFVANMDESEIQKDLSSEKKPIEASMFLATGSADPYAYVYNVGEGSAELLQRLEGHTDRVYCVDFHPSEPLLASCSADFTIKVWGPGGKGANKKRTL